MKALIDACADIDKAMIDGQTPLFVAAYTGHVEVVRLLVRAGADPTLSGRGGLPIDQICGDEDADKANEAEIRAILEQAGTRATT